MWSLERLCVSFGDTRAVDDVSMTIDAGERVVILGPSGSGKSTLLRVIAGLQPPDSGDILIAGERATDRPPHRRDIGLMFQDPMLFPHRTVHQNVEFGLRMQGASKNDRSTRVNDMLALVGLPNFGDRDVATLSGGEAQRVALARALAPRPTLLLLDEPFAAIDRALRDRLVEEIPALLRATNTAAVHVTHDHDEAFAIGDRVGVMTAGRLLRIDSPERLYANPQTSTVAHFLGHTNIVNRPDHGTQQVIRRDAATIDSRGELVGTVTASRFRGDHVDVTVATTLGELQFRLTEPCIVGDEIRLRLDPERIAEIRPE